MAQPSPANWWSKNRLLFFAAAALAALVAAACGIVALVDHRAAVAMVGWFTSTRSDAASSAVLLAETGLAVVAWTGAVIARQIRGPALETESAFGTLEFAMITPVLGALAPGAILRIIAVLAAFYFLARLMVHLLMRWVFRRIMIRAEIGDVGSGLFNSEPGRKILTILTMFVGFPAIYTFLCGLVSIAIVIQPTSTTVAWGTLAVLIAGLYFVRVQILRGERPADSKNKSIVADKYDAIVAELNRRANELRADATVRDTKSVEAPQSGPAAIVKRTADDGNGQSNGERSAL